jgi:hypothetical protein
MFDDIKCNYPIPDGRVPPGSWFQTKSLYCCLDKFTITAEGWLIFHRRQHQLDGEQEIRPGVRFPQYKLTHVEDIDMGYHGDIRISALLLNGSFADYVVRFTHGNVEGIRPYDELSEIHQSWFFAKDEPADHR